MPHLVLLGDSIFDNIAYTEGGPDVIAQVRDLLPAGWNASLLAVDGATTADIGLQLARIPHDASHLALSIGGNDALREIGILDLPARGVAHAMSLVSDFASRFEQDYREAVGRCLKPGLPLAVCMIYNGSFDALPYQKVITTTLMILNDAILRTAVSYDLPVIDLRSVCRLPEDYANPIEPSSIGGRKIASTVVSLVTQSRAPVHSARVIGA